ncbi:DUF7563 family protein [Halorussus aquaticus]|uniref:DUF7563 family protein n=1 Tax=Halorussus TaxID=1070314 RepID=UPI003F5F91C5
MSTTVQDETSTEEVQLANNQCRNCGTHVSDDFRRVYGSNDDVVYACRTCVSKTILNSGGSACPERRERLLETSERGDRL